MNQRLPKSERIRRRADYLRIQDGGLKIHTPHFVCFTLPATSGTAQLRPTVGEPPVAPLPVEVPTRLGITVSRRVGCAVVRNRVKRLLKEVFRHKKGALPRSLDLVVIARAEAAKVTLAEVERELLEVGRRLSSPRPSRSPRPR